MTNRPHLFGTVTVSAAYWTGPLPNTVDNPPWHLWLIGGSYSATPYLWGPASVNLDHGSTMYIFADYLDLFRPPHTTIDAQERCLADAERLADRVFGVIEAPADEDLRQPKLVASYPRGIRRMR